MSDPVLLLFFFVPPRSGFTVSFLSIVTICENRSYGALLL